MTGLMAKASRHGRVRSQDGWRERRREGQSPAYSVRQERIGQGCESFLSLRKAHSQRNSSVARTSPNIHRHPPPCRPSTRVGPHRCTHVHTQTARRAGAAVGGLGQTGKAFTAASDPARNHTVCVSLPERPTRSFQALTLLPGPQEPDCIITALSTHRRPQLLKGFLGTTQRGSLLRR